MTATRRLSLVLLCAAVASPVAAAQADVSPAFGNTIVSTYPDGRQAHLWLKADGTYTATGRRKTASSGTWSVKGAKVCLKQRKPTAAPFSFCTAAPSTGEWTAKAVTGERISVRVVKGVVR